MKKIAIIGASYLQKPLVQKAQMMGLQTICFAWPEGAVCKDIADKFYPISILQKEDILFVCQQEQIDGICTIASDIAAPTVAYVAEKMGLVGNPYSVAVCANNKYLMRQAFSVAGLPNPMYAHITSNIVVDKSYLHSLHCTMKFPLIVKPCDRSGSLAVVKVNGEDELFCAVKNAQSVSFVHEAMVEEYIEGREISVESISYNGKHYPLQITDKETTGSPHYVELAHHQPADLPVEMYKKIYALTSRALTALGITNGASHSEFRITDTGQIVIMEIGGRMGGDFIGSNLVYLSTGYDFVRGVIELAIGSFQIPQISENRHSGVYFLCNETKDLLPIFRSVDKYPCILECELFNSTLHSVACSADRNGYFIYQSDHRVSKNELI